MPLQRLRPRTTLRYLSPHGKSRKWYLSPQYVEHQISRFPPFIFGPVNCHIVCGQSGAPRLQVNPAQSRVAVSDRQKLLVAMYEQFRTLYTSLLVLDPSLPARHALAQEVEVYEKSTKTTYRNVGCGVYV